MRLILFCTLAGISFAISPLGAAGVYIGPDAATEKRYAPLVEGVLTAWESADCVCLGEDHGRKNDSDLRIALVRHPKFADMVDVIVVEFANPARQDVLDHFILNGAEMSRKEMAVVWRDAEGAEVWESPIYEAFLRAVREINFGLLPEERVRVIGGDSSIDWSRIQSAEDLIPLLKAGLQNRGGNIRTIIAEQVLDKKVKALAIYGAGHCVKVGMGFPGELMDAYPGKIWSVYGFFGDEGTKNGRKRFGLGDQPAYVVVTGTEWAAKPASRDMFLSRGNETIGDMLDAVAYYGNAPDRVVPPDDPKELEREFGAELARRRKLLEEAQKLGGK